MLSIQQLKQLFSRGKKPTQEHFAELIESFRHKTEDTIQINDVNGLAEELGTKSNTSHTHTATQIDGLEEVQHITITETETTTTTTTGKNTGTTTTKKTDVSLLAPTRLPFSVSNMLFVDREDVESGILYGTHAEYVNVQKTGAWHIAIDSVSLINIETIDGTTTEEETLQYGSFAGRFETFRDKNNVLTQRIYPDGFTIDEKSYFYERTAEEGILHEGDARSQDLIIVPYEKNYIYFTYWQRKQTATDQKADSILAALAQAVEDAPQQYYDLYYYAGETDEFGQVTSVLGLREITNFDEADIKWNLTQLPADVAQLGNYNFRPGVYRVRACCSTGTQTTGQKTTVKAETADSNPCFGLAIVTDSTGATPAITLLLETGTELINNATAISDPQFTVFKIYAPLYSGEAKLSQYVPNPWGIAATQASAPQFQVVDVGDNYTLQVSYDNGETWDDLFTVSNGMNGMDGMNGADGADGMNGTDGAPGEDGKSAYEYAQDAGYSGTEEEFAEMLAGLENNNNNSDDDGTITASAVMIYDASNNSLAFEDSDVTFNAGAILEHILQNRNVYWTFCLRIDTELQGNTVTYAGSIAHLSYSAYVDFTNSKVVLAVNIETPTLKNILPTLWRATVEFTEAEYQTLASGTDEQKAAVLENKSFTNFIAVL